MKIAIATCNRADYSKLAPIMEGLKNDPFFEVSLVVMGSHLIDDYGNTYKFIQKDGFNIDSMLHTLVRGETEGAMVESMGLAMIKLPDVLNRLQPDLVMVHGDRFDAMSVAIAASVMNVRVVHIEGGEVSGTIDDVIRHAITKLSHYHICCTKAAKRRIESMCEDSSRILLAGCPAYDELIKVDKTQYQQAFKNFLPWSHVRVKNYIICVFHPVTTAIHESIEIFGFLLEAILAFEKPTIILFPNVDAGSKELVRLIRLKGLESCSFVKCYKHVPFHDFIYLMANCGLMLGNSSAGIRESNVWGVPVINIGTRQTGRQSGANVSHLEHPRGKEDILRLMEAQFGEEYPSENIYGDGHAVERICKYLKGIDKNAPIQKVFNFDLNLGNKRSRISHESLSEPPLSKLAHSNQLALAVDLGGSFIRVALVDDRGEIVDLRKTNSVSSPELRLQTIVSHAKALLENKGDRVVGVGISTGGRVDSESGEILFATQILNGWSGVALRKYVQNNLGLPCYVENDGNCAALAELHFGKHSLDSFVMFHFGTGIGGGVIEDGILTPGNTFSAGEFGHIVVSFEGGPQCMCGNSGCVEAYAGGWALSRITEGKKFIIPDQSSKSSGDASNPVQVAVLSSDDRPKDSSQDNDRSDQLATAGSELAASKIQDIEGASEYIHKCERAIAAALCSVYNSYNPPVAVLGGPLAPLYFDGVVAQLNNNPTVGRNLKVVLSTMREMSLKGAATLMLRNATSIAEEQQGTVDTSSAGASTKQS